MAIRAKVETLRWIKCHPVIFSMILLSISIFAFGTIYSLRETGVNAIDGWWWAVVTLFTVGYGDSYPKTDEIRAVATLVMIFGFLGLTVLGATIINSLVQFSLHHEADAEGLDDDFDRAIVTLQAVQHKYRTDEGGNKVLEDAVEDLLDKWHAEESDDVLLKALEHLEWAAKYEDSCDA